MCIDCAIYNRENCTRRRRSQTPLKNPIQYPPPLPLPAYHQRRGPNPRRRKETRADKGTLKGGSPSSNEQRAVFFSSLVEAQSPLPALVSRLSLSKRSEGKRTDKKEEGWMKEGLRSHDERKKKSDYVSISLLRGAFVVVIVVVVVLIVFTRVVL
jgi:hypothetical protein